MRIDALPIWLEFALTILLVLGSLEVGLRLGRVRHRQRQDEKESPVSAIASVILGLTSFMLAFTFGIVSARHDTKEALVRDEAVAIRIAWRRAKLLPESDRPQAITLLRQYVDECVTFALNADPQPEHVNQFLAETQRIQDELWNMAIANAQKDMNPGYATSYMDSLSDMTRLHASRVATAIRSRVAAAIWIVLYSIATLGMVSVGYQTGVAGSRRSLVWYLLAVSFSMVFSLIVALDQPASGIMKVNQQPLIELRDSMAKPF